MKSVAHGPDVLSESSVHRIGGRWGSEKACWGRGRLSQASQVGQKLGEAGETSKGKGSSKCEDAGVGPQTHPARTGAPSEALQTCEAEVTLSGFTLGDRSPERWRAYLPLSIEPGELWALLCGGLDPPFLCYSLALPEMLGGCGVATWGLRQDSGGAQARPHPEGGSCTGCLWLGPGSPTRGLPLPLWAGTAATVRPTP